MLIHLVDGTQEDIAGAYRTIRGELHAYGEGLEDKTELLALNKIDALTPDARKAAAKALQKAAGKTPFLVSGVSGEGGDRAAAGAFRQVQKKRMEEGLIPRSDDLDDDTPTEGGWRP